ncbi:MAG TPA: dethiobiotin synthase [Terriglobales bacterium]|nr:dethiobiotin synthase [Terriglobales bacterium]
MTGGCFITGTDTGVGKTVVAAMLCAGIPQLRYWKPIQCGVEPSTDRADVAQWAGLTPERLPAEAFRLDLPASPHVAAAAAGVSISFDQLRPPAGAVLAEGAGGVMVPINDRQSMLDLMVALGLPVILVARTALGTINHTLLSLEALDRRGLRVAGVVLNGTPVPTTTETIRGWGKVKILAELPPLAALNPASLRAAFEQHWRGER